MYVRVGCWFLLQLVVLPRYACCDENKLVLYQPLYVSTKILIIYAYVPF